jgi:hypothetical protein
MARSDVMGSSGLLDKGVIPARHTITLQPDA